MDREEAAQAVADEVFIQTATGEQFGPIRRIFLDDYTGWPSFATINLGTDPNRETFVALHQAEVHPGVVMVPYGLDLISSAATIDKDEALSTAEEDDLFDHYGVPVDGVFPVVEHLGSALVPHENGDKRVAEVPTNSA